MLKGFKWPEWLQPQLTKLKNIAAAGFSSAQLLARNYKRTALFVYFLLAWFFLVLLIHIYDYHKLKRQALAEEIFPVSLIMPKTVDEEESINLPGNVMAWNQSYIYARVDGYIKSWLTDYGAVVKKGEKMAEIQTPTLNARYGQAEADVRAVKARYDLAALTAHRYEAMKRSKAVAIQAISVKQALLKVERARYEAALFHMKTIGAWLKFKTIVAPFDGVVISRNINLGDYVSKQGNVTEQRPKANHMFIVADIQKVRLFVSVPERFSRFLAPGFKAEAIFPQYPDRRYTARFLTSAKAFDPETRTVVTEFVIENKDHSVWPGSYATVNIKGKTNDTLLSIPTTAMIFDADSTRVATVDKDNRVHFKMIKVEQLRSKTVRVASGLLKTDRVINTPNLGLLEGSKVKIVEPAAGYFKTTENHSK